MVGIVFYDNQVCYIQIFAIFAISCEQKEKKKTVKLNVNIIFFKLKIQ